MAKKGYDAFARKYPMNNYLTMRLYFLIVSMILTVQCFAQLSDVLKFETKILYNYSLQPDSTDSGSRRTILTALFVNDTVALFQSEKKTKRDSALFHGSGPIGAMSIYTGDINPTNFQIIQETKGTTTTFEPLNGLGLSLNDELYCYEEENSGPTWELALDTMRIHGIQCQKALFDWEGRRWVAWFAPDIPISFGPYKFKGLPGLVVRAYDVQNYFVFDLIAIETDVDTCIPVNAFKGLKIIHTSKEEFYRSRRKFRENMYEIAIAAGAKLNQRNKEFIASVQRSENNHIEKY